MRSFAEHRAAGLAERRTAIVERAPILGLLFLYNNLHVAHHLRATIPWYRLPEFYRLNRSALIAHNGGLVYRSYFELARRYLFRPQDAIAHPLLRSATRASVMIAGMPMYDFPWTAAAKRRGLDRNRDEVARERLARAGAFGARSID